MRIFFFTFIFDANVLAFFLYGLDKHKAHYNKWRIPEAVLLGLGAIGGAYGAGMGMILFRHKTKHKSFLITVPVCFIVWAILLAAVCWANGTRIDL